MSRPKRRFTTPLGTGRSKTLGANDPRARRDSNARQTQVPDPVVSSEDVASLEARLAALEASSSTSTTTIVDSGTSTDTPGSPSSGATVTIDVGTLVFEEDTTYMYVTFGVDGDWTSDRWNGTDVDTLTGSGTKPVSLSDLQNLDWPVPAP